MKPSIRNIRTCHFCPLIIVILFMGCSRQNNPPTNPAKDSTSTNGHTSCLDFSIADSVLPFQNGLGNYMFGREDYLFDTTGRLVKHVFYSLLSGSPVQGWTDSFSYSAGNMVKSYYSLGTNNSSAPYTTSEYDYNGHVLIASRYYLGSEQLVHSVYNTDDSGRITSITQYADNLTLQYTPTRTYQLHYDQAGDLDSATDNNGNVYYQFLHFDNHPNPLAKLPFDFAYNVLDYCPQVFSKNNYRLEYSFTTGDSISNTLSFNYDTSGKVKNFTQTPSAGRVSNGSGPSHLKTISYHCN